MKDRYIKLYKQITCRLIKQKNIQKTDNIQYEYEQNNIIIHNKQLYEKQLQLILLKNEQLPDMVYHIYKFPVENLHQNMSQLNVTQLQKIQPQWKIYQRYQKHLSEMILRMHKIMSVKQLEKLQCRTQELWTNYQTQFIYYSNNNDNNNI